jgi:hypothetical protein
MHDFVKTNTNRDASSEDFPAALNRYLKKSMDPEGNGRADWFSTIGPTVSKYPAIIWIIR